MDPHVGLGAPSRTRRLRVCSALYSLPDSLASPLRVSPGSWWARDVWVSWAPSAVPQACRPSAGFMWRVYRARLQRSHLVSFSARFPASPLACGRPSQDRSLSLAAQLAFLTHSPLRLLLTIDIPAAEPESCAFCSKSNQPLAVTLLVSVACTLLSCSGDVPAEPGVGRWKQFQVRISQIFPDLLNVLIVFPG